MSKLQCRHHRFKYASICLAFILALLSIADDSYAQYYSFEIPSATVTVEILKDGSIKIDYDLFFTNLGTSIDVVDIGMPSEDYVLSSCTASLDGEPQTDIRKSEYIDIGIEVHLNPPIYSGTARDVLDDVLPDILKDKLDEEEEPKGRLQVSCINKNMIYEDTTDPEYATLRFTPTWFSSDFLSGDTNLQLRYLMPGKPKKSEIKWHNEPFDMVGEYEDTGQAMVVWNRPNYYMNGPHQFGLSFPRRYVTNVIKITIFELAWMWFLNSPGARVAAAAILLLLFTLGFFMVTKNTGCVLWGLLVALFIFCLYKIPISNLIILPLSIAALVYGIIIKRKKTGWDYIRAVASVPGGGIKRGLTAVEAAVMLQLPPQKIFTIMVFGMIKKGILKVTDESHFTVKLAEGTFQATADKAKIAHIPVRYYEKEIMLEIDAAADKTGTAVLSQVKMEAVLENLIRKVADKISGFDVGQTKAYYGKIIEKAWKETQKGAASLRPEIFDTSMEWMMLDKDFKKRWDKADLGPTYHPLWIGRSYAPGSAGTGSLTGGLSGLGGSGKALSVSVGDVAKSIAGRFENIGNSFVDSVDFSSAASKTGIDLSGLDKLTSDILTAAKSSGGGGWGGGGGGCACACAGCACACACAGGGR